MRKSNIVDVTYYEDSGKIYVGNVLVESTWNNEANQDYPEDLTWGRDIGFLCRHVANASAQYQHSIMSGEIKAHKEIIAELLETLDGIRTTNISGSEVCSGADAMKFDAGFAIVIAREKMEGLK